jgi:hypothetical protein
MAQLCTNAPPITNSALNGSHLHQCPLTHSECTQPTQMKCSPYTLKMHSTNSNQVLSLHTQNALNQLKSSALLTHSECTQPTQIKVSPYTLRMHSTNSNEDLQCWNVDTCTSNASKYLQRAPIQHLCTSKLEMASKASELLQSCLKLLQGSKSASKNPPEVKTCTSKLQMASKSSKLLQSSKSASNSANLHLQHTNPQDLSQCTQAIKPLMMQFA